MEDGTPEGNLEDEPPAAVSEWLGRIAADRGVSEAELLERLLSDRERGRPPGEVIDRVETLEGEVDAADDRVDELSSSVDELRADVADKIEDVRDRVVQVKREADTKAPGDHDHPDLEDELASVREDLDSALDGLDALGETVSSLDDRVTTGFENFEQVVERLTETTDALSERADRANGGVNNLHRRVRSLEAEVAGRAAVADLLAAANRHGAGSAGCESCDEPVRLGLLTEPRCPRCRAGFTGFSPKRGFFGSHTLETGDQPALTGEVAEPADTPVRDGATAAQDWGSETESDPPSAASAEDVETPPTVVPEGDATAATETDGAQPSDRGADAGSGRSLRDVEGVGPAFEERLRDAGVGSVRDLATADADALADAVDVSPDRTARWIDRASGLVGDD